MPWSSIPGPQHWTQLLPITAQHRPEALSVFEEPRCVREHGVFVAFWVILEKCVVNLIHVAEFKDFVS